MAYKIEGTVSDDAKIYVINTSDDSLEQVKSVSAGAYTVDLLDEENVHVIAVRNSDSKALAYGAVDADYVFNDYNSWFAIAASADDGVAWNADYYPTNWEHLSLGANSYKIVMRFTNVSIPKDAQIETAYLRLVSNETRAANTVSHNIRAIDENNSPQRTGNQWDPDGWDTLPRTSASSANVIPANFPAGAVWTSNSLVSIIQELVNRGGWVSGNALTLLMEDPVVAPDSGNYKRVASWDNSTYDEPRIYVEWRA